MKTELFILRSNLNARAQAIQLLDRHSVKLSHNFNLDNKVDEAALLEESAAKAIYGITLHLEKATLENRLFKLGTQWRRPNFLLILNFLNKARMRIQRHCLLQYYLFILNSLIIHCSKV